MIIQVDALFIYLPSTNYVGLFGWTIMELASAMLRLTHIDIQGEGENKNSKIALVQEDW